MPRRRISFYENAKIIILDETSMGRKLAGLSDKRFLQDADGGLYIFKSIKGRSVKAIMGKDYLDRFMAELESGLPIENKEVQALVHNALSAYAQYMFETPIPNIKDLTLYMLRISLRVALQAQRLSREQTNEVLRKIDQLVEHVSSTLFDSMHTEKLGPLVAKAFWGDAVVVPETFYPREINEREPEIISRLLRTRPDEAPFNEFMRPLLNKVGLEKLSTFSEDEFVTFFKKNAALKHFTLSYKPNDIDKKEEQVLPSDATDESIRDFYQAMKTDLSSCSLEVESPNFWLELQAIKPDMQLPKASDLPITPEQKKILGKLYAMALITGHYDILNNINGTNSGSMAGKPASVDWGNSFMIGFGGHTKDENIFNAKMGDEKNQNPFSLILGSEDYASLQQNWSSNEYGINSNEFTFPFINQVFPFLPRLLVQDLFNLDDPDVFAGFVEFVQMANDNKERLVKALDDAWPQEKSLADKLNKTWYAPENAEHPDSVAHIVHERIEQLNKIVAKLQPTNRQTDFQNALIKDIKEVYRPAYETKNKV